MLEGGIEDGLALNTYVNIMVRWGDTEKAKAAAELILERAQSKERRVECVRMLFNLEQHANPTSPGSSTSRSAWARSLPATTRWRKGCFFAWLSLQQASRRRSWSDARKEEFHARANTFFRGFPSQRFFAKWRSTGLARRRCCAH
jgi:hypothetical protein